MNLPKRPTDLGFPDKFASWRPHQTDAVLTAAGSDKRFIAQNQPTGSGKSLCYMAGGILNGGRILYLTSSKGLQDQLMDDFHGIGLKDIRGKANYPCSARPDYTCEDGHIGRCPVKGTVLCPHTKALITARQSKHVVTNYSLWTSTRKYGNGIGAFDMIVMDEAHNAVDELANALQVRLSDHEITEMLGIDWPADQISLGSWKKWANAAKGVANERSTQTLHKIRGHSDPKQSWSRDYNHFRNLVRKLSTVASMRPDEWIWEQIDQGYQFDPIRLGRYSEPYLFAGTPKILMTSATIHPRLIYMFGVKQSSLLYQDFPAVFPPVNGPVYIVPTMQMNYRNPDIRQCILRVDQIIRARLDRKGIVHTVSRDRRDVIMDGSRFSEVMITNFGNDPVFRAVTRFKNAPPPRVLISPSVSTGYDFPGRDCEYQVLTKIPFPDNRSRIVQVRSELDKDYFAVVAMTGIQQMCGRGRRYETDRCENFILDDNFSWFYRRYSWAASKWFKESVVWLMSLPNPAPKL